MSLLCNTTPYCKIVLPWLNTASSRCKIQTHSLNTFALQQHYFVNNKNYFDRKWDKKSIKNFNQLSKCVKTLFIFSQSGTLHNTLPKLKIDQKRGKTRAEKKFHVPD